MLQPTCAPLDLRWVYDGLTHSSCTKCISKIVHYFILTFSYYLFNTIGKKVFYNEKNQVSNGHFTCRIGYCRWCVYWIRKQWRIISFYMSIKQKYYTALSDIRVYILTLKYCVIYSDRIKILGNFGDLLQIICYLISF